MFSWHIFMSDIQVVGTFKLNLLCSCNSGYVRCLNNMKHIVTWYVHKVTVVRWPSSAQYSSRFHPSHQSVLHVFSRHVWAVYTPPLPPPDLWWRKWALVSVSLMSFQQSLRHDQCGPWRRKGLSRGAAFWGYTPRRGLGLEPLEHLTLFVLWPAPPDTHPAQTHIWACDCTLLTYTCKISGSRIWMWIFERISFLTSNLWNHNKSIVCLTQASHTVSWEMGRWNE